MYRDRSGTVWRLVGDEWLPAAKAVEPTKAVEAEHSTKAAVSAPSVDVEAVAAQVRRARAGFADAVLRLGELVGPEHVAAAIRGGL